MNTTYRIRGAQPGDANPLIDVDIKCFDDAWSPDEWARIGADQEYAISVATYFGTPIGFALFRDSQEGGGMEIVKLAVKPQHRLKGVSVGLLSAGIHYAQTQGAATMFIIVPESTIYPGPRNTSGWLIATGFTATKPLIKNRFKVYGEVEDGVKFTMSTRPSDRRAA